MEAVKNDVSLYRKQREFFFLPRKESQLSSSGAHTCAGRVSGAF